MSCLCQTTTTTLSSLYDSIRLIAKTPRESRSNYNSCSKKECLLLKQIFERITDYLSETHEEQVSVIPKLEQVLQQLDQLNNPKTNIETTKMEDTKKDPKQDPSLPVKHASPETMPNLDLSKIIQEPEDDTTLPRKESDITVCHCHKVYLEGSSKNSSFNSQQSSVSTHMSDIPGVPLTKIEMIPANIDRKPSIQTQSSFKSYNPFSPNLSWPNTSGMNTWTNHHSTWPSPSYNVGTLSTGTSCGFNSLMDTTLMTGPISGSIHQLSNNYNYNMGSSVFSGFGY